MFNVLIAGMVILVLVLLALWIFGERGHLMLPSTRRILPRGSHRQSGPSEEQKPSPATRRRGNLALDVLHAYVYGRWTNQFIFVVVKWLMPRFSVSQREHWANSYHGKVLTPELAVELVNLDHKVNARNLEQIIPYPVARDVILRTPVAVTLYECACRHTRGDVGCKPTNVCMVIGSAGDFTLEHNPHSSRRINQAEALDILRAEHERGHVHSAWFKDVLGDRLYAICNCCKCCCGGIRAMTQYGIRSMASSGYVASVDETSCTSCGLCVDHCPFDALTMEGAFASVNSARCMGCGVCQSQCAFEAIALRRDETKPAPLDVRVLA